MDKEAINLYDQAWGQGGKTLLNGSPLNERLAKLHLRVGIKTLTQTPASSELVNQALTQFKSALQLDPSNPSANGEQRLARRYLNGYAAYTQKDWETAVSSLRTVYDERPKYLSGQVTPLLYEAYV